MPCAPPTSPSLPATLAVIGAGRRRPPLRRQRRPRARPCASSPARPCPPAPTPSSSRRTRERDGDKVTVRDGTHRCAATSATAASTSARARRCSDAGRRLGPARGLARRRHGPRPRSRAPPPARRRAVDRRRAGAARRRGPAPARSSASNHLGVAALAEAAGAETRSCSASPATRARASMPTSPRRRAPTSSSPSAAPRSATTTSSAPCSGARHGAGVLEDRHAAGQAADVRPPGRIRACWACPATRSPRWSARACSCVPLIRALLGPAGCRRSGLTQARAARRRWRPTARASTTCAPPPRPGADGLARGHARALAGQLAAGPAGRKPTACWCARPSAPALPAGSLVPILPLDF